MDTFTVKGYDNEYENFCKLIRHDEEIVNHLLLKIKETLKDNNEAKSYLEIGPGTGLYFNKIALSGMFSEVEVIEPNKDFLDMTITAVDRYNSKENHIKFKFSSQNSLFQKANFKNSYDIIIAGHCIYYFNKEDIFLFVKLMNSHKKSSSSRVYISFNTIDPKNEFHFKDKCEYLLIKILTFLKEKHDFQMKTDSNESVFLNKHSCLLEYYTDIIKPLTEETFEVDSYDVICDFHTISELSSFVGFLFYENEINLKLLSEVSKISIENLKEMINVVIYEYLDEEYKEKLPVFIHREEINLIF